MATTLAEIETLTRLRLDEVTARFWSSTELQGIITAGIKDLWRDVANLKQEHFLTIDEDNVTLEADTSTLTGVPNDVHKIYLIEALDTDSLLDFVPLEYNHPTFQAARQLDAVASTGNDVIYYAVIAAGSPVGAPSVYVAPQIDAEIELRFVYVPTIGTLTSASDVPIPGDCDNALVAWTVAYARAKERDDRAPDPLWLSTYKGEKDRLVNSLGVRQLQEPLIVDALFQEYN